MIDISSIPDDVLIARGLYSTVRKEHEDAKKQMQILCGQLSSAPGYILRYVQPDNNEIPDMFSIENLITSAKGTLDAIRMCANHIESLAKQRAELKQKAWGK